MLGSLLSRSSFSALVIIFVNCYSRELIVFCFSISINGEGSCSRSCHWCCRYVNSKTKWEKHHCCSLRSDLSLIAVFPSFHLIPTLLLLSVRFTWNTDSDLLCLDDINIIKSKIVLLFYLYCGYWTGLIWEARMFDFLEKLNCEVDLSWSRIVNAIMLGVYFSSVFAFT